MPPVGTAQARRVGGARPDGTKRWRTLEYPGVLLPAPYVPHGQPVLWPLDAPVQDRVRVSLGAEAEHAITDYVRKGGSGASFRGSREYADNFWQDWRALLPRGCPIASLERCDLSLVERAARAPGPAGHLRSVDPKDRLRSRFALLDGQPQPISPHAVDNPGVFVGRTLYSHLTGRLRRRMTEDDVEANVDRRDVDWVARWRDPVTRVMKYARLSRASDSERVSEEDRFDLATRVEAALPRIARVVDALLKRGSPIESLRTGLCLWLVSTLAIRVGSRSVSASRNSGAFGVTSLLAEHVRIRATGEVVIRFPGKEGVPYLRTLRDVPPNVATAIRAARAKASDGGGLFPGVSRKDLNLAIARAVGIADASAKVVRTALAGQMFCNTLREAAAAKASKKKGATAAAAAAARLADRLAYARVAVLLNHRKMQTAQDEPVPDLGELEDRLAAAAEDLRDGRASLAREAVGSVIAEGRLVLSTSKTSYVRRGACRNNKETTTPAGEKNWNRHTQVSRRPASSPKG